MAEIVTTIRLGLTYLAIIGLTIVVQAIANRAMKSTADFFENKDFPQKTAILMILLLYILFLAILVDIIIWSIVLMLAGIFHVYWDAFTFATDSFSTLGNGGNIEPPWEFVGPVIAVNGIVIIAFGVSCMYSILYKA